MIQDYVLHCLRVQSSQKKMNPANLTISGFVFTKCVTYSFLEGYSVSRFFNNTPPCKYLTNYDSIS